jgi:nucleoside-diphosphate-sugar epimerase
MKALVTGANGFLGRHVVSALLARSVEVRAMVRPAARIDDLGWPASVEVFRADLRSSHHLEEAFEGVDVLVHLAAAHGGGEDALFRAAVVGTERLLAAMARTDCKRLLLASSFAVYDWSSIRGTLDESSPLEPIPDLYARDGYSIAKSWQERIVRQLAAEHGWGLTVIRPGNIWGRDHAYLAALGLRVGKAYLVIGPLSRLPMVHVDNCADLFALAAVDPRAVGETFNVVDHSEQKRIWTFLGHYLRGSGERGIRIPIPYRLAYLAVSFVFATFFKRSLSLPHILIPCRFESRLKPLRYTNARAKEILGWQPPLDFRECLARTFSTRSTPALPAPALLSSEPETAT